MYRTRRETVPNSGSRTRRAGLRGLALALALAAATLAPHAEAEMPAAAGADLTAAEIESLATTLEDREQRRELLSRIRTLAEVRRAEAAEPAVPSPGARVLVLLSDRLKGMTRRLAAAARNLNEIPDGLRAFRRSSDGATWSEAWLSMLGRLALVLGAGALAEVAARALLRRPSGRLEGRASERVLSRLLRRLGRTGLDLTAIAAFVVVAYLVLFLVEPGEVTRLVTLTLVNASAIARGAVALGRAVLSPGAPELRLPPMGDETANYWFFWLRRLTNLAVYGYFLAELGLLVGLPPASHGLVVDGLAVALTALLVLLALQNRAPLARAIRGTGSGGGGLGILRRRLADTWHLLATVYLLGMLAVWLANVPGGFAFVSQGSVLSVTIVGAAAALAHLLRGAIRRAFTLGEDVKVRLPGLEARATRYVPALEIAASGLVYLTGLLVVLEVWGVRAFAWLETDLGQRASASALTIGLVLAAALALWELLSSFLERLMAGDGKGALPSARARTLLPLARNAGLVALVLFAALIVLSELGVDIGPLLAGAGVIGLAVGFGAQTLVKDIITGVFILVEDSITVGDFVEIDEHSGTVESMSIRTMRLRDLHGAVHTIPFSDVSAFVNRTKDYSFAMMDIGVAYRENVEQVMGVMREVGAEMQRDPDLGSDIKKPIDIMGLQSFDDSAVVVRARIKVVPGKQWAMRRAFNLRLKQRFDELGIEIPFPHQTVYFGEDREGKAPAAAVRLEDFPAGAAATG